VQLWPLEQAQQLALELAQDRELELQLGPALVLQRARQQVPELAPERQLLVVQVELQGYRLHVACCRGCLLS
jgi:hypothetical protein